MIGRMGRGAVLLFTTREPAVLIVLTGLAIEKYESNKTGALDDFSVMGINGTIKEKTTLNKR